METELSRIADGADDDPTTVDRADLVRRSKDHAMLNDTTLVSVIKGATLANAAFVIYAIRNHGPFDWNLWLLWLASFGAILLTYFTTMIDSVFSSGVASASEVTMPFIAGLIEFLLFSVLQDNRTIGDWHLLFALYNLASALKLRSITARTQHSDFAASLHSLVKEFRATRKRAFWSALVQGVVWIVLFFLARRYHQPWRWISAVLAVSTILFGLYRENRVQKRLSAYLDGPASASPSREPAHPSP